MAAIQQLDVFINLGSHPGVQISLAALDVIVEVVTEVDQQAKSLVSLGRSIVIGE